MDQRLQGLQNQWRFVRECSKCVLNGLCDDDLDRTLPRKGLDTLRKHLEEMVNVQNDYISAIESGVIHFGGPADADIAGVLSKEQQLAAMRAADDRLESVLAATDANASVKWFSEYWSLTQHLAAMISHETLHIGQMIAFCYVLGIEIPKFVRDEWALSGR